MIYLITGLPGNGKSLYTIGWVKAWAEKEGRQVYYSGLPELKLPWQEIDADKWMEAPPNSIVVIDECQRVYRNRSINTIPPKYVTELETHRHQGIDLVFITQHPMLIDPALRRLVGSHKHLVRIFGMEASTVHEWNAVRENCDKPAGRKDSEKVKWVFDKSIYGLYKSAEVHTMKRNIPLRLKLLLLVPLLVAGAIWYVYNFTQKRIQPPPKEPVPAAAKPAVYNVGMPESSPGRKSDEKKPLDPVESLKRFAVEHTPRVTGLQHTAPRYDELTKPVSVPVPASCIASGSKCQCYSQQASRMDVPEELCRQIIDRGYFVDFDPNGREGGQVAQREKTAAAVKVLDRESPLPMSGAQTKEAAPVFVMDRDGYGVLGSRGGGGT